MPYEGEPVRRAFLRQVFTFSRRKNHERKAYVIYGSVGCRVSKMYRDRKDGLPVHVGYVIGAHWLEMFTPVDI